jgi:hypothetical protein
MKMCIVKKRNLIGASHKRESVKMGHSPAEEGLTVGAWPTLACCGLGVRPGGKRGWSFACTPGRILPTSQSQPR